MTLIALLQNNLYLLICLMFIIGACVGSFLNVVIYRLPIMLEASESSKPLNLMMPHSHCPHCKQVVAWQHNIPLLSYWLLKRQCAHCKKPVNTRYFWVELITALLSAGLAFYYGYTFALLAVLFFTWLLIPMIVIDWKTQLLPDELTFSLLWLGLLVNLQGLFVPLTDAVIGAIVGYLVLWLIMHVYRLITGKWGMGYGDFKLFAALGAWLGWQSLSMILAIAALGGIVVGIIWLKATRQKMNAPIAFGPFLAIAGWMVMICSTLH